jgi:Cu(I)/Ag(I) efflux system membrane fusion protein
MKIKSLFTIMLVGTLFLLATSCGSKKEEHAMEHEPVVTEEQPAVATAPQFEVDAKFQQQVSAIFTSYVGMKDAFVASDAGKVKQESEKVASAIAGVDMALVTGAAHNDWMTFQQNLTSNLKAIQGSADIKAQRTAFKNFSDDLYKTIKAYGLGGTTAYYEYCPMAFNNSGAYWLSDNAAIRNPYFGDKMLKCGSVEEELK